MAVATQPKKLPQKTWGFGITPVRDQVSQILFEASCPGQIKRTRNPRATQEMTFMRYVLQNSDPQAKYSTCWW